MTQERPSRGPAIRGEGIGISLRSRLRLKPVLRDASFLAPAGAVTAIVGPNGAGKTTLLRSVVGLQPLRKGEILIGSDRPAHYRRSGRLGYQPESVQLPPGLTIGGLWRLGARWRGVPTGSMAGVIDRAVARSGLDDLAPLCSELSKGMARRTAFALVLVGEPDCVVLDEPWAGLDPAARVHLRGQIIELAGEGRTVVVATHELHEAARVADRVLLVRAGSVAPPIEWRRGDDGERLEELFEGISS